MFPLFSSLKNFVKPQSCVIDNPIFRLHYRVTLVILIGFSLMVTAHQYFGDPIDCITKRNVPSNLLDTYCWIHSTYSIENSWLKEVGVDVPYPGVDNSIQPEAQRAYHRYYQWVGFFLFFQAILFYLPRHMWKAAEGGLVKNLILGLDKPIVKRDEQVMNIDLIVDYVQRSQRMHKKLFYVYTFAETLNLANVIAQMFVIDRFLGGQFFTYGWRIVNWYHSTWPLEYDPMIRVFPRVTKCEFFQYGPSAGIERFDTMCLLPINILNEKVYIFLWFWFFVLAIVSAAVLAYRISIANLRFARTLLLAHRCGSALSVKRVARILNNLQGDIGDWWLLRLLSKNMSPLNFIDFMFALEEKLKHKIHAHIEINLHHAD